MNLVLATFFLVVELIMAALGESSSESPFSESLSSAEDLMDYFAEQEQSSRAQN